MSYPWWRFKVTFFDGESERFIATGVTPTDALVELMDPHGDTGDFYVAVERHGDVKAVEYLNCETFGLDEESDRILLAEAEAEAAHD